METEHTNRQAVGGRAEAAMQGSDTRQDTQVQAAASLNAPAARIPASASASGPAPGTRRALNVLGSTVRFLADPAALVFGVIAGGLACLSCVVDGLAQFEGSSAPYLRTVAVERGVVFGIAAYLVALVIFRWADWTKRRGSGTRSTGISGGTSSDSVSSFRGGSFSDSGSRLSRFTAHVFGRMQPVTFGAAAKKYLLIFWTAIAVSWIPWLMVYWPGALRDDTLAQYFQSQGYHGYYTRHPLMGTFIFGLFWRIGQAMGNVFYGLMVYTIIQTAFLSLACALVLCYMRKRGVPAAVLWLTMVFFTTGYVVAGVVPTMSKDSLWAIVMAPLALIFIEACLTRGQVLRRWPVLVSFMILAAFFLAIKRTGIEILAVSGIFLIAAVLAPGCRVKAAGSGKQAGAISTAPDSAQAKPGYTAAAAGALRPRRPRRAIIQVLCALVIPMAAVLGIWDPVSVKLAGAAQWPPLELYGFFSQPIARVGRYNPAGLADSDRREINTYMKLSDAVEFYNPSREDETMYTIKYKIVSQHRADFIKLWLRIGLKDKRNFKEYAKAYAFVWQPWFSTQKPFVYPSSSAYLFDEAYMAQWGREVHDPRLAERALAPLRDGDRGASDAKREWQLCAAKYFKNRAESSDEARARLLECQAQGSRCAVPLEKQPEALSDRVLQQIDIFFSSMGLYVTLIPLAAGLYLLTRRRWLALAAWVFLLMFVLQLIASPAALYWYPVPLYFVLPAFAGLIFDKSGRQQKAGTR